MVQLHDRVAIVTGAASGIGAALAEALVHRNCQVTVADMDGGGADRVAAKLNRVGPGRATAVAVDVRDSEAVATMVNDCAAGHGRLDLLINNAGIGMGGATDELSLAHWRRVIDVNLYGVINGVLAAYPLMLAHGDGHIVNMASLAGLLPSPGFVPYSATKYGIVGLSLGLRAEAAQRGVKVSVVCPGNVDTPLLDTKHHDGLPTTPSVAKTDIRAFVTHMGAAAYPPQRLAEEILRGVAANRGLIVAPASARSVWRLVRLLPGPMFGLGVRTFEKQRRQWGWDSMSRAVNHGP